VRRVKLGLLGGFRARLGPGPPLTFQTRKAQGLLAYLALPAGRSCGRERLAALLWGDVPEPQARSSLRHALYEIRTTLAAGRAALVTTGDTVALDTAGVDVDVDEFARLLDEGTVDGLETAMTLYRGDLLAGLSIREEPWEAWLNAERERWRERAIEGLARLLSGHEAAGRVDAAIRTAQQLLALDPLREPMHRALMRLQLRAGRRDSALRQYQLCVGVLQRELGVEPEGETRELYRDILQHRAAAGRRGAAPSPPPTPEASRSRAGDAPLIGRDAELARLRRALDQARAGRGTAVALIGEAGIGKSRLVEELIGQAEALGCRVCVGRSYESDQILLFGPLVDALRSAQLPREPAIVDALGPVWRAELTRLLPELGPAEHGTSPVPIDYRRLFEAITQVMLRLAAREPLLVVLEDVHWADELTVRFLAFVGRQVPSARILVVVTARQEELPDAPMLRRTLEDLTRDGRLVSVVVAPLSPDDTRRLVRTLRRATADLTPEILGRHVWSASEGNPFVVVELMRDLEERAPSDGATLPPRVREVIRRRFERIHERGRPLLALAAVIGREFDFELLRHASRLDDDATAAGVEELVRRRILTSVGERLGFTHERLREVAYTEVPAWRRAPLHRAVAETIETVHRDRLPDVWEALADHWERGEAWSKAYRYHRSVAERAKDRYAYRTAERAARRAAEMAARHPEGGAERARALALVGDVISLTGDLDRANDCYAAALDTVVTEGDRRLIANKRHRARLTSRGGGRLAFYEHGTGDETLLLTNPLIYGLEILQPLLEHLCQDFQIITMDLRGTGRSDPIPAGYTTADHAADIGAVIEASGRGPVTAIGISKSSNMLVRLAVAAPALLKRLVLVGTPLDITPGSMSLVPSEADDRFRAALRAGNLEEAMHWFVATVVTDPGTGELAEQFTRNLLRLPRESILSTWTPDPTLDISAVAREVRTPTLVMHGTEDRRVSVAAARYLAEHIPDARLHLFECRGHLPIFTATPEFCEVLRDFVRTTGA
jgi:DNA-binding SARP family transcriptional activator/pimeloyl-ACP methyl ester carboxylesterase